MSTATLTYTLPDEQEEFNIIINGLNFALVCWDMDVKLRNLLKYGGHKYDDATLEYVRDTLHEMLNDHDVSLDMIT